MRRGFGSVAIVRSGLCFQGIALPWLRGRWCGGEEHQRVEHRVRRPVGSNRGLKTAERSLNGLSFEQRANAQCDPHRRALKMDLTSVP